MKIRTCDDLVVAVGVAATSVGIVVAVVVPTGVLLGVAVTVGEEVLSGVVVPSGVLVGVPVAVDVAVVPVTVGLQRIPDLDLFIGRYYQAGPFQGTTWAVGIGGRGQCFAIGRGAPGDVVESWRHLARE